MPAPVEVARVNHYFGDGALRKQILFDVSTEIDAGEIVIVTGPSGSGKTTMLTLVGALRRVQVGSVRILGEELNGASPRSIGRVRTIGTSITISAIVAMNSSDQSLGTTPAPNTPTSTKSCHTTQPYSDGTR